MSGMWKLVCCSEITVEEMKMMNIEKYFCLQDKIRDI